MTQEEKQLLLKDLCARLPYGVNIQVYYEDIAGSGYFDETVWTVDNDEPFHVNDRWIENIKPYLRPMSSMTEEEWMEFEKEFGIPLGAGANATTFNVYDYIVIDFGYHYDMYLSEIFMMLNWFYSRHYDINHLIEKGLALEAKEGMYETNK